jgi:TonB family protein
LNTQRNTETLLTFGQPAEASQSGGSKKILLVAAVLVVAAAGGYFGWTKMHSPAESTAVQKVSQPPSPVQNAAASPVPTTSAPMSTVNSGPRAETLAPTSEDTSITESQKTSPGKSRIQTNAAPSDESDSTPEPTKAEDVPARSSSHSRAGALTAPAAKKPVTVTPESPSNAEAVLPPSQQALNLASNAGDKALAGIVGASANHVALPSASGTLKVSQGVTQGLLIKKVSPAYPQQALQMRIQGSVQLQARISREGQISNVKTLSGDAILARAAVDAVKQWKYKPYTLNGEPVGIQTEITVVFKLPTR